MNEIYAVKTFDSPLGTLRAAASSAAITGLCFDSPETPAGVSEDCDEKTAALALIESLQDELERYFSGRLREFSVPLELRGTPFQKSVWNALRSIPYGQTSSYIQLAGMVTDIEEANAGSSADALLSDTFTLSQNVRNVPARRARAVGNANGKNPVVIVIPCHRVIAANGGIGGYSGGLWRKEKLLLLEKNGPSALK